MATDDLPAPVTVEQMYLAAIVDELRQLRLATQLPPVERDPSVVELREPRPAVALAEPRRKRGAA